MQEEEERSSCASVVQLEHPIFLVRASVSEVQIATLIATFYKHVIGK